MIARIINSEQEYLNLIADAIEFGTHRPNRYADPDADGMSISDSFDPLPVEVIYEYLGVYPEHLQLPDRVYEEIDEDGKVCEASYSHIDKWEKEYRNTLKVFPDTTYVTPKQEDYPIMVYWHWDDGFDRFGKVTERFFLWWSLKELTDPNFSLEKIRKLWEDKFEARRKQLDQMSRERYGG